MEHRELIETVAASSQRLLDAGRRGGWSIEIPTCPGWTMRDLIGHLGGVQRWATAIVATQRQSELGEEDDSALFSVPDGDAAFEWFEQASGQLVSTLRDAPLDLDCFTFLPSSSPLYFWCRRQAHEASIHCADGEIAVGIAPHFSNEEAVDGLNEIIDGFFSRRRKQPLVDTPFALDVIANDVDASWKLQVETHTVTRRGSSAPDVELSGPVSDLYLTLWNRHYPNEQIKMTGDESLMVALASRNGIRWS